MEEIGLDTQFASSTACDVVETASTGFASNEMLIDHLLRRYPRFFSIEASNTQLLCRANTSSARVGEYDYDRKNTLECSNNLGFEGGGAFTSIAFLGSDPEKTPPPAPTLAADVPTAPEDVFPMHVNWMLGFVPRSQEDGLYVQECVTLFSAGEEEGQSWLDHNWDNDERCGSYSDPNRDSEASVSNPSKAKVFGALM